MKLRRKWKEVSLLLAAGYLCLTLLNWLGPAGTVQDGEYVCYNSSVFMVPGTRQKYYLRTDKMPSYAVSFGTGRLGNQMSTFASVLAYEKIHRVKSFVTARQAEVMQAYFTNQDLINAPMRILEHHMPEWKMICWENPFECTDKELKEFDLSSNATWQKVNKGKFLDLGPYINDVYAFAPYLPHLRRVFAFKEGHMAYARERLGMAVTQARGALNLKASQPVTVVSIHVRRQDYARHMDALYKEGLASRDYFVRAINYFRHRLKDKAHCFIVVSDDMDWCKEQFSSFQDVYFVGTPNTQLTMLDRNNALRAGQDIGNDLALLAHANHSILSHGTYGMWGALLAGGEAVLPGQFKHVKESREVVKANLPGWVFL